MKLVHQSVHAVFDRMGHPSPDFGGSSAAILAGVLGLSMVRMALAVSAAHADDAGEAERALAEADRLAASLSAVADDDRRAFQAYLQAMKTEQEEGAGLHAAARATFDALFAAGTALVAALELSDRFAEGIARPVESDLFGGAALIDAAFAGVSFAIETNMRPKHLDGEREDLRQRLVSLDAKRKKAYGLITKRAGAAGFSP